MNANKEKCADKDKSVFDYNEFRRLRYFHGMLLDDKDFQAEQEYHVNKRRFLNRMLHGSGVVCGLELKGKKGGQWIEVTSGLALDCSGNEIWVPRNTRIDLASLLPPKDKGKNQPECEEKDDEKPNTYHIGIRYDEKPSNPVSVYLPSGGCEERSCENSRYKEGFCIEIVPCCPESYDDGLIKRLCECKEDFEPTKEDDLLCPTCNTLEGKDLCECIRLEQFCEQSVPCPECCSCDKPCHVVLGKIEVDEECRLVSACINECRRYVLTGRLLQHMLVGVFAGGEEYFEMDVNGVKTAIPEDSVGEWAHNPIKALCWWLPFALAGGKITRIPCDRAPSSPTIETQMNEMREQFQTMKADFRTEMIQLRTEIKLPPGTGVLEQPPVVAQPTVLGQETTTDKAEAQEKKSGTKSPKANQK